MPSLPPLDKLLPVMNEGIKKLMSQPRSLNFNTVLLSVVTTLSSWTLTRVFAMSEQMSALIERDAGQSRELMDMRSRLAQVEVQLQANTIALARLK